MPAPWYEKEFPDVTIPITPNYNLSSPDKAQHVRQNPGFTQLVRKKRLFATVVRNNDHFANTGSAQQTQKENSEKERRVSQAHCWENQHFRDRWRTLLSVDEVVGAVVDKLTTAGAETNNAMATSFFFVLLYVMLPPPPPYAFVPERRFLRLE